MLAVLTAALQGCTWFNNTDAGLTDIDLGNGVVYDIADGNCIPTDESALDLLFTLDDPFIKQVAHACVCSTPCSTPHIVYEWGVGQSFA